MYLNIIKDMYDKPTTNIILTSEKLKRLLPRSRKKSLFNIVLEVLTRTISKINRSSQWGGKSKTVSVCS